MLKGEPAAAQVELLLRRHDPLISSVNLAEVIDVLIRRDGFAETEIRGLIDPLLQKELKVISVSGELAWSASYLRARHYHRRDRPLSLADCIALATSIEFGRLATADALLAQVARDEGVDVVGLPNSEGVVP